METREIEITYPSADGAECPFPLYERLREDAPVYRIPGTDSFLVTRWEDVKYVTRHPEVFSSDSRRSKTPFDSFGDAKASVRGVVELDPPEHKPRRDACFRSFTPGRLKTYEPMVAGVIDRLIDAFVDRGRVEFVKEFSNLLPMRVMMNLFGFVEDDLEWVQQWSLVETSGSVFLPEDAREQQRAYARRAGTRLLEELHDRHDRPRDDVLTEIIQRNVERVGSFDPERIRADASNIFRGGIITVAHALPMAMLLLLQNPEQLAAVRSDFSRIPRMFEESLRIESPSQWNPRIAREDTELGGVPIPKGAYVMIFWAAGNRDRRAFDEPERFDASRQNAADHLSFGDGPHFCLGAPLARLEARGAFERLFARLGEIRLAAGADCAHVASPAFRGLRRLDLEFDPAGV